MYTSIRVEYIVLALFPNKTHMMAFNTYEEAKEYRNICRENCPDVTIQKRTTTISQIS